MDKLYLPSSGKELDVEICEVCDSKMVNVDYEDLKEIDAKFLNASGIRWSNPNTPALVCVQCEIKQHFCIPDRKEKEDEDNDDWSKPASAGSLFGTGIFGGGFGGFGGGSFGGAGASR